MGYHIYTTDGIILKRTNFGEANILLYILTSDLGLITASARSARLSKSKLRPALGEYSNISLSCIKAKNGWKVTNVSVKNNFFFDCPVYSHKILSQVSLIIIKMITGEIPHKEVFDIVKTGFEFLPSVSKENLSYFEILIILRILYCLGYVAKDSVTELLLEEKTEWGEVSLQKTKDNKTLLVSLINKALKESHL